MVSYDYNPVQRVGKDHNQNVNNIIKINNSQKNKNKKGRYPLKEERENGTSCSFARER